MTNEEYVETQTHLGLLASMILQLDLAEFLKRARHADNIGWIIDPTLARQAGPKLTAMIKLAEAGSDFQAAARAFIALQETTRR